MDYIALFYTTTDTVGFMRKLQKLQIPVDALPVPRNLSASCGIAAKFSYPEEPTSLFNKKDRIDKVYAVNGSNYHLVYQGEYVSLEE